MAFAVVLHERRKPAPDLQERYGRFNDQLFGGRLPEIPIYWDALTSVGGKVQFKVRRDPMNAPDPMLVRMGRQSKYHGYTVVPGSLFMVITNLYQRDDANLNGILVHEMIHVWFAAVEPKFDEQHGAAFMAKLREIQAKVDFPVPLKDAVSDLSLASTVAPKPVTVVWGTSRSGTPTFAFLPDAYRKDPVLRSTVHTTIQVHVDVGYLADASILTMETPAWTKVRVASVIPRQYKPRYLQRTVLQQRYPDAHQEAAAATPVWSAKSTTSQIA